MVVLVDTNVILDYLMSREPFCDSAKKFLKLCAEENVQDFNKADVAAIEPEAFLKLI